MKVAMGSQVFHDVEIPVLWGTRAVLLGRDGRLSVIELGGKRALLEIVADAPAPGTRYSPRLDGFAVLNSRGAENYTYSPSEHLLSNSSLGLADCEITPAFIRVGTNTFYGNRISGYGVGIAISENGISMGSPLPPDLAKLVVDVA